MANGLVHSSFAEKLSKLGQKCFEKIETVDLGDYFAQRVHGFGNVSKKMLVAFDQAEETVGAKSLH